MNKERSDEILKELKSIIPNPKCELEFNNTFELIIAVSLSAQTTDKRVNEITKVLFSKYDSPKALMNASFEDVYEIIKPLGLANSKAKNIISISRDIHNNYNDVVPNKIEELIKLDGVGRKTASVVLAVGFNIPALPVDTHLIRMANRLGYSKSNDPIVVEKDYKKYIKKSDWILAHHLLLLFGRYHCKASNPNCECCKLTKYCKYDH
ncbi:MAG: endonuclease III [Acholeplasmatales bacterium]|nr:endonuclease III [Acholeplasmatales bacterium]